MNRAGLAAARAPRRFDPLPPPMSLVRAGLHPRVARRLERRRDEIASILAGEDPRMLAFVGPCSVHHPGATRRFLRQLAPLAEEIRERVLVVPRLFFEKPRTRLGWTGLASDPGLDGSGDAAVGIRLARGLLREAAEMGLPAVTEILTPGLAPFLEDLLAAAAIGARTVESQPHRQVASALPCPVGFKNATCGNVAVAIDAMVSAETPHRFLWNDPDTGEPAICRSSGNEDTFAILRGGASGTNFDAASVEAARAGLVGAGFLPRRLVIDASHGNCGKDHRRQREPFLAAARLASRGLVAGAMLEAFLEPGAQKLPSLPGALESFDRAALNPRQSVTDPCVGWEETEQLLREAFAIVGGEA